MGRVGTAAVDDMRNRGGGFAIVNDVDGIDDDDVVEVLEIVAVDAVAGGLLIMNCCCCCFDDCVFMNAYATDMVPDAGGAVVVGTAPVLDCMTNLGVSCGKPTTSVRSLVIEGTTVLFTDVFAFVEESAIRDMIDAM